MRKDEDEAARVKEDEENKSKRNPLKAEQKVSQHVLSKFLIKSFIKYGARLASLALRCVALLFFSFLLPFPVSRPWKLEIVSILQPILQL